MRKNRIIMITLVLFAVSLVASAALFADGMTGADFIKQAKSVIDTVTVPEAKGLFDSGGYVFVDVREPNETQMGNIPGAVLVPRGLLEFRFPGTVEDKDAKIVVYCKSGGRSALATYALLHMGYRNVVSMDGGWSAWEEASFPVE
jgi:rhodanese-related sulfurtransferase